MLERSKAMAGFTDPIFGALRSPKWREVRNNFLLENSLCEACGVKAEIAHHILPYHLYPKLELDTSNLIVLCDECHLVLAHLKSFRRFDPDIKEVARLFRKKVENAKLKV
jgi:5-methylcytosine-specific restriction endonuclease McrA